MVPWLRPALLGLVAVNLLLLAYGVVRYPGGLAAGGWPALTAAVVAQLGCVVLAWRGPLSTVRMSAVELRTGLVIGGVVGVLYGVLLVAEYLTAWLTRPSISVDGGYAIVAAIVVSDLLAGYLGGLRAALWNALVEYLVWTPFLLLPYYLGVGTAAGARVMKAEGNMDDFAHSGMSSFNDFEMRDHWGAAFFHLAAALFLALLFGGVATLPHRVLTRRRRVPLSTVDS
jgi:hypothetical protein